MSVLAGCGNDAPPIPTFAMFALESERTASHRGCLRPKPGRPKTLSRYLLLHFVVSSKRTL
ncbi:Uncharacterised protein [Mycobacteroides abscessus subsp. abscessus]|nr:Uncharacterised protein [Mycobacteroides abscessus subsp. abscessus]